ncbi:diacylglycerol/lipid kinase family protein [Legionella dresdenensis]|uniref:Diacylglycerol/lipid kinase family protein n=1 Tax=Legionella dresdenensis TaxID=450200 RepID=A0ABV8CFX1_9GAMM
MSKSIAIVINNHAKNAGNAEAYLTGFTERGVDYHLYKVDSADLENTLKRCVDEYDMILAGGGDGTVRSAAHWCAHNHIILGILPLGTLNHFAKELMLPTTLTELIAAIKHKTTTTIDLAEVNGKIFVNNSSLGFYPKLARKRDYYSRFYNKWLSYIPSFFETFRNHETYSLSVKSAELDFKLRTSFFMISNNLYSYQFPLTIARENFNAKRLGLYFFKHGRLRLMKIIRSLFNRKKNFEILETTMPVSVSITNHSKIAISLDGDTFDTETPLHYTIHPDALILLTNKP